MEKQVRLVDVMGWVQDAVDAAQRDVGDAGCHITALSYRSLLVEFRAETGGASVFITTRNWGFSGCGEFVHRNTTSDGVEVVWQREDIGIPTGEDWLPRDFISWMEIPRREGGAEC